MPLTEHQQERHDEGLQILKNSNRLLVKGSAGVGKTYMMDSFIRELKKMLPTYKTIYCSAPTNKAVAVLKSKVTATENLEFITLHSALKIRRVVNNRTGEAVFKPQFRDNDKPFAGVSAIIVDESSMVSEDLHNFLEEHATRMNVKVILIADHKQLNPVKEVISPIFYGSPETMEDEPMDIGSLQHKVKKKDHWVLYSPYPEIELREIVRQAEGNPIIDLSYNMKKMWDYVDDIQDGVGYMHSRDREKVIASLAEVNGTDELKYLGYTNADVDRLNTVVRERIYGANPNKVEEGETIVFNTPYKDLFYTNQEMKVDKVILTEQNFYLPYNSRSEEVKLKFYVLNGHEVDGGWTGVYVIHEEDEKRLRTLAAITKKACLNREMTFRDRDVFLNQFADIKYNHAITVHKSQGSTYQHVILNITGLNANRNEAEKKRLFYTAITRASEKLTLFTF